MKSAILFPIMNDNDIKSIPWEAIAPHEAQAKANHHQSLEMLARRGGLSPCEAVAIMEGRKWERMGFTAARERLRELVTAHLAETAIPVSIEPPSVFPATSERLTRAIATARLMSRSLHLSGHASGQIAEIIAAMEDAKLALSAASHFKRKA